MILTAALSSGGHENSGRPNLLLVSIDTLRADRLAAYGYSRETLPSFTQAAERGVLFARAYSQAPSTVPTHASMLTGLLPFQHGMFSHRERLAPEELTLAEHLAANGYKTFAIASSPRFRRASGYPQGFDVYENLDDLDKNSRSLWVTDFALQSIRDASESPYFGFVHYFDPHAPYAPPEPFKSNFGHGGSGVEGSVAFLLDHDTPDRPLRRDSLLRIGALYDGSILYLDQQLARLLDGAREAGGKDGTLVVITSDHGEEFKEHGGLLHSSALHEELLRVPLVMEWAGRLPSGRVLQQPAQTVDLFPTLCELLGVPTPSGLAGRSHASTVTGAIETPKPAATLDEIFVQQDEGLWGIYATLPTGRFKLTVSQGVEQALFKVDEDPGARTNVIADYAEEAARLLSVARRLRTSAPKGSAEQRVPTEPELQDLRSLGYLQSREADTP